MMFMSAISTGEVQFRVRAGRGAFHFAGIGAYGVSLFFLGCGFVVFLASSRLPQKTIGLQLVATSLLFVGGLLVGLRIALDVVG
jgi:hypothetical protein